MPEKKNIPPKVSISSWAGWFDKAAEVFEDPRMKIAYYRDGNTGEPYSYESMQATYQDLWDKLQPQTNDILLDVGCGVGFFEKTFEGKIKDFIGTDVSPQMITSACQLNPDGKFLVCQAENQPFKAGQFDRILCYGVTQYLKNIETVIKMLDEFLRISKNQRTILIGDILTPEESAGTFYKKQSPRPQKWWPNSLDHNLKKLYVPKKVFTEFCEKNKLRPEFYEQNILGRHIPTPRYDILIRS